MESSVQAPEKTTEKPAREIFNRFRSLDMVRTGWGPKLAAVFLLAVFLITTLLAMFVPWRQSVSGDGQIIVFSPMDRPQTIEAQIPGRIENWYVRDGQTVQKGQLIAELNDIDARFLDKTQIENLQKQKAALTAKRDAATDRMASLSSQVANARVSRDAALPAAEQRIKQTQDRLFAAQQSVDVAEQNVKTAQWQVDRINALYEKGLRSQRDQQVATLENIRAQTELQRAKSAYDVVKKDTAIAGLDYKRVAADTDAGINAIHASLADANQTNASTNAEIAKLEIDIRNLNRRVEQRQIKAPCAGRVVRVDRVGAGETVAAGTVLATIVPQTKDRAAAIMVRDYDAPLVRVDDQVRLSISGWPSLQFVGWPSVAVGTFAGRVAVIDAVDDGHHYYRVIVVPDTEAINRKRDEPWPSADHLRPGAKATGWILLREVPVWFELWRQFNGFQPTIAASASGADAPSKRSEKQTP